MQKMKKQLEQTVPVIVLLLTSGTSTPHYCYHVSLSTSGNCRMCIIEVENSIKPIISCTTPQKTVTDITHIFVNSPLTLKARENTIEFLLVNHPLDCPVCEQGGACDLQDQAIIHGVPKRRFHQYKRTVKNKNAGTSIKTLMTRCIHCTRCVRFSIEILGIGGLGIIGRGNSNEIGAYLNAAFSSELSANVVDLCPVGQINSVSHTIKDNGKQIKV